jgi:hypothetical protein
VRPCPTDWPILRNQTFVSPINNDSHSTAHLFWPITVGFCFSVALHSATARQAGNRIFPLPAEKNQCIVSASPAVGRDGSQVANAVFLRSSHVRPETLRRCNHRQKRVSSCMSSIDHSLLILQPRTYALFLPFTVDSRATLSCLSLSIWLMHANLFQFRSILIF